MPVLADAFDIQEATIVTVDDKNAEISYGDVTGVTIDGRRPEEFVNVIGGQIRRRRPEETDWSVDKALLYDNLNGLKLLKDQKFDIVIRMVDPLTLPSVTPGSTEQGQLLTIKGCRIAEESINVSESGTVRMSGRSDGWRVDPIGSQTPQDQLNQ